MAWPDTHWLSLCGKESDAGLSMTGLCQASYEHSQTDSINPRGPHLCARVDTHTHTHIVFPFFSNFILIVTCKWAHLGWQMIS